MRKEKIVVRGLKIRGKEERYNLKKGVGS